MVFRRDTRAEQVGGTLNGNAKNEDGQAPHVNVSQRNRNVRWSNVPFLAETPANVLSSSWRRPAAEIAGNRFPGRAWGTGVVLGFPLVFHDAGTPFLPLGSRRQRGSEHPDSDFHSLGLNREAPSHTRNNTRCHGFHDSVRFTKMLKAVRSDWPVEEDLAESSRSPIRRLLRSNWRCILARTRSPRFSGKKEFSRALF